MLTAQEMITALERKLKIYWELFRKYEKKYLEKNNDCWYDIANRIWSKIELLQDIYKEFTGLDYEYKEE